MLLDNGIVVQFLKKLSASYASRSFHTIVLKRAYHLLLSCARCIQSTPSHSISLISTLILSFQAGLLLPLGSCPSTFSTKKSICIFLMPNACYIPNRSHACWNYPTNNTGRGMQIMKFHVTWLSAGSVSGSRLGLSRLFHTGCVSVRPSA